jgi:hypothetical protein
MGELVVPANAPGAHDSNSAKNVNILLNSNGLDASRFRQEREELVP